MHVELHIFISILIIMMARSTNYLILCLLLCFLATITDSWSFQRNKIASSGKSIASQSHNVDKEVALENSFSTPVQENHVRKNALKWFKHGICASTLFSVALSSFPVMHSNAADTTVVANTVDAALLATPTAATTAASEASSKALEEAIAKGRAAYKIDTYKVPYFHNNVPIKQFLGKKATLVFNMKIDDPQTSQFSEIAEVYNRYKSEGLNALSFPSDQGWFEPDDDETVRIKGKEYYGFGDYPNAVIFDKVSHRFCIIYTNCTV